MILTCFAHFMKTFALAFPIIGYDNMTNEFMIPSDACIRIFLERNQDLPNQFG